jgi:hypothetical protein
VNSGSWTDLKKENTFVRLIQPDVNKTPTLVQLLSFKDGKEILLNEENLKNEGKRHIAIPRNWKCRDLTFNDGKICNCGCGHFDIGKRNHF